MSTDSNEAPQIPSPPSYPGNEAEGHEITPPQPPQAPSAYSNPNSDRESGSPYTTRQASDYGYRQPENAYVAPQQYDHTAPAQPASHVIHPYAGVPQANYGYGPAYHQPYPPINPIATHHSTNSLTMGIISVCAVVLLGWIPAFGIIGIAGGLGLGIPAILQAKKAEAMGVAQTPGKVMGWIGVVLSILMIVPMVLIMIFFAAAGTASYTSV